MIRRTVSSTPFFPRFAPARCLHITSITLTSNSRFQAAVACSMPEAPCIALPWAFTKKANWFTMRI
jgi:hypothetical protein